jgi:hypothetical protein
MAAAYMSLPTKEPVQIQIDRQKEAAAQVVSEDDSERTHFLTRTNKKKP